MILDVRSAYNRAASLEEVLDGMRRGDGTGLVRRSYLADLPFVISILLAELAHDAFPLQPPPSGRSHPHGALDHCGIEEDKKLKSASRPRHIE